MLVSLLLSVYAGQGATLSIPTTPRPLVNIAQPEPVSEINLSSFDFLKPDFGHGGVYLSPIKGEPVAGQQYVVEARIYGEDAMARATFEVLDESGQATHTLPMGRRPTGGRPHFLGMMTVPAKPFRIALSSEATDGRLFRRVNRRLFRPLNRAPVAPTLPFETSPSEAQEFRRLLDEAAAEAIREMKEFTEDHAATVIVMPRLVVSNVTYAPFLSAAGRPLGLRITYDVEFSAPGLYNPELQVYVQYPPETRPGSAQMRVVNSSITPIPREPNEPSKEPVIHEYRTSLLEFGATYTYQERTVYHIMAELVPDFISRKRDIKRCIFRQQYAHAPDEQAALMRILNSDAPASYRVSIRNGAGFEARIEHFYGEGALYRSFEAEGTPDCGPLF